VTYTRKDLAGKRVHFVGIGGSGMSGLARIMASDGVEITGSDVKDSTVLSGLRAVGVQIFVGHRAENIVGTDILIYSSAIPYDNIERVKASEMAIPQLTRAEALEILMSGSMSIAIAGTHGKTTTTSMLTVALQSCGVDPSFAIGGTLTNAGSNAHRGTGNYFIVEADESDGSFITYHPHGAIITNIEHDHVDYFSTLQSVVDAFDAFIHTISPAGFLIYCADDQGARSLGLGVKHCETFSYGVSDFSDLHLDQIDLHPGGSTARVLWRGRAIGNLEIQVPGHHNLLNAAAALTAGLALDLPVSLLLAGLAMFRGTSRRFELKGQIHGIRVIDDYAHHPTEVSATLIAARRYAMDGRVFVIFQPHRYTRTRAFINEFAESLDLADQVWVLEIYGASEKAIPGVTGMSISKLMKRGDFEPNFLAAIEAVTKEAVPGDVILTLGAGDVSSLAPLIVDSLEKKYQKK
jgi:UDP-N-acetylmuramate--alanine ligase